MSAGKVRMSMSDIKRKANILLSVILAAMVAFAFMPSTTYASSRMKVEWFNVGAGDSMFVKFPNGRTALIDGGTVGRGYSVVSKLKKMHVTKINYCISTHPDSDHCGGLQAVFENLNVRNFYYPGDASYDTQTAAKVVRLAESESGCRLHHPKNGTKLKGGKGAYLKFVQANVDYSTDNEDSLASFINYGRLQILTCGDNEDGSEDAITKHNVDILQLPHHGSKYATNMKFIRKFDPEKVVVSTDGHKYGHPNKEVFRTCKKYDKKIKVWRTDKKGDIVVTATKSKWKFKKKGVAVAKYCRGTTSGSTGSTGSGGTVFITRTGTKYHRIKSCRGLVNATAIYAVSQKEAVSRGLTKCSICW